MIAQTSRNLGRQVQLLVPYGNPFYGAIGIVLSWRSIDAAYVRVKGGIYSMSRKNLKLVPRGRESIKLC